MAITSVAEEVSSGLSLAVGSDVTEDVPTHVEDDYLVWVISLSSLANNEWPNGFDTPSGWELLAWGSSDSGNDRSMVIFGKRASGSEPSTYSATRSSGVATANYSSRMSSWRGVDLVFPVDTTFTWNNQNNSNAPDPDQITTVTDGAVVVTFVVMQATTIASSTVPTGYTEVPGGHISNANSHSNGAYKTIATAGVEDPGAWSHSGSTGTENTMISIVLRPETGADYSPLAGETALQGDVEPTGTITTAVPDHSEGDYLLWSIFISDDSNDANDPGIATPTGWTLLASQERLSSNQWSFVLFGRLAGASEPSTYSATRQATGSADTYTSRMSSWTGIDSTTPIDATAIVAGVTDSNAPDPGAITTQTDDAIVVQILGMQAASVPSSTVPSGYTPAGRGHLFIPNANQAVAYKVVATAGSENAGAWAHGGPTGTDNLLATVALRPAFKAVADWSSILDWSNDDDWSTIADVNYGTFTLSAGASSVAGSGAKTGASSIALAISSTFVGAGTRESLGSLSVAVTHTLGIDGFSFVSDVFGSFAISEASGFSGTGVKQVAGDFTFVHSDTVTMVGNKEYSSSFAIVAGVTGVLASGLKEGEGDFDITETYSSVWKYVPTPIVTTPEDTYKNNTGHGPLSLKVAKHTKGYG